MSSEAAPSIAADCPTIWVQTSQQVCLQLAVTQSLAEVTVLAQPSGVDREAFIDRLDNSVMESAFTRYKTPASGHLDLHPDFTPELVPAASLVRRIEPSLTGYGSADQDFAALIEPGIRPAGPPLESAHTGICDGLDSADTDGSGAIP
jgi:hypothetical protein